MFARRIGWLSLIAGAVFALGLSLSSVAWAQKGGPPATQAKNIPGIDIKLNPKPHNKGDMGITATTDKNGEFVFADLEPGIYTVDSLSGFPVGKSMHYSVTIETGWSVPVDPAVGDVGGGPNKQRKSKNYNSIKSNTSSLSAGPLVDNVDPTGPGNPLKGFPVSLGNNPGKDKTQEKYSTTISNIKFLIVDVLPDGVGQLPEPVEMEIHAVGSEIMISGPGTGVVGSRGANPGEEGYAIKEQGIKRVAPVMVAAPMFLRGRVSVSQATTGPDAPATSVGTPVDDVPVPAKPRKRGFKLPLPE